MLVFVPEATFTQQFIMYSFFIGTPILLLIFIGFLGYKSVKQNNTSKKCQFCGEFIRNDQDCEFCKEDLSI